MKEIQHAYRQCHHCGEFVIMRLNGRVRQWQCEGCLEFEEDDRGDRLIPLVVLTLAVVGVVVLVVQSIWG